jgi:flagellar basal-body rod modification protein FlgD
MSSVAPTSTTATTPTSSTSTSSTSGTSTSDAINKLSGDFNNFLTLLTTQLKNQDPLSPMDSTQFTQQLVAFTGVEQQINTNAKLDQLIGLDKSGLMTGAAAYIGTEVEATSGNLWLPTGSNPSVGIGYTLPDGVTKAALAIYDQSGNVIRSGLLPDNAAGHHSTTWDGTNDAGAAQPSGVYSFSIQGLDKDGKPVSGITTSSSGIVTNVGTDSSNNAVLSIGALQFPLSSVLSVKKPTSSS